jgi:short subunit dehydrogenase-like uncharacterized protein
MAAAASQPGVLDLLKNPFSLTPGFIGPKQPTAHKPMVDEVLDVWVAPFVMATINTRNVHRSNFLLKQAWGADFVYDEMVITGPGDKGQAVAEAIAADKSMSGADVLQPGEGPSRAERDAGSYDVLFIGQNLAGQTCRVSVQGDRDPGYGSTSKMISEAAICLLQDAPETPGGIWTPASSMGQKLIDRLQAHAGLTFRVE